MKLKQVVRTVVQCFGSPRLEHTKKKKKKKKRNFRLLIERYAQFLFLKKGLKLLHHILCIIFLKKIFQLYSII